MNNLILKILPDIESTVKKITRNADQQNEIVQYTVLRCYDYEETVKRLHAEGKLGGWIYTVASKKLLLIKQDSVLTSKYPMPNDDTPEWFDIEKFKPLLTETEWTWLKAYMIDGGYSNISNRTGIQRKYVSQRIKNIIEKCKRLKHTLY